ncbi:MAG: Photosynthesis system assembly factor [Solirubrobacteraceae bacterium]|jgi:hypothetical protein|nr:Photosynthesis system assembly factor [Solirubrobacteraceae bacterium]
MPHVWLHRCAGPALVTTIAAIVAIIASDASAVTATPAAVPAKTVTGALITRPPHTLAKGAKVRASTLGIRTFTDARHGFALADVGQAQYPAATVNGGKTWRTNGPALHLNAAQAPLVVLNLGAANRKMIYAYGGGQAIDATTDGGGHWFRALFDGLSMSVTRNVRGHLVGFIDGTPSASAKGQTWQYVTKNGGRTWRLDTTIGGS